jgi:hypothetical protein
MGSNRCRGSVLSMVSKRSCRSGTKMMLYRLLENDYQRLVPLWQRGLGVTEAWEDMASVQSPFLVSVASLAMPPRLIFFSVVLMCFRELCQLVQYIAAMGIALTFYIACIVGRLLR